MATKYQYESPKREMKTHLDEMPLIRERRRMLTPKKKLLVVYSFIIVGAFMALIIGRLGAQYKFNGQPQVRASAQVVAMSEDRSELELAFPVDGHGPVHEWTASPDGLAVEVAVGDWVGVRYRIAQDGSDVLVLEVGLVAIPPPLQ